MLAPAPSWPQDVTSRHRLATLALERGDLPRAAMQLQALLADSRDHAPARLDLARIALLRRDSAGYLAQARYALAQARSRDRSRGANDQFAEILRLGGMRATLQEVTSGVVPLRDWRHVEPAQPMFRDGKRLQAIEQTLSLLADVDRTAARIAVQETHPVRTAFRVAREVALAHPACLAPLGFTDRAVASSAGTMWRAAFKPPDQFGDWPPS